MTNHLTREYAQQLDQRDPLKSFREKFFIPLHGNSESIYFCGNSLGLQPKSVEASLMQELKDWRELGVEGHFKAKHPWMPYHEFLTNPMASLVGAKDSEVVLMNTLTVNLHLMMVSFYRPTTERYKIMMDSRAFPSDRYAVASQIECHGFNPDEALLWLEPNPESGQIELQDVEALLKQEGECISLILLEGVNYYSGQLLAMQEITALGHQYGCKVGWDLAHAVGNVPLNLHNWQVDFAVWCTYKYLNGGPGCLGGCYVHDKYAEDVSLPRFAGWWGHDKGSRFAMPEHFKPIPGAEGWQISNPPIMPLACLKESLAIFEEASIEKLREKSLNLTGFLIELLKELSAVKVLTPTDEARRGCQISLVVPAGKECFNYITSRGVICDWREPDVIRLAPVPLYNTYEEVYQFFQILKEGLR